MKQSWDTGARLLPNGAMSEFAVRPNLSTCKAPFTYTFDKLFTSIRWLIVQSNPPRYDLKSGMVGAWPRSCGKLAGPRPRRMQGNPLALVYMCRCCPDRDDRDLANVITFASPVKLTASYIDCHPWPPLPVRCLKYVEFPSSRMTGAA
jgi:hypothetical protein